ncbi:putative Sorting nexin mvp-1 [Glarea lozoyensis 74030]|uniref:Putative Sorting nexin mvp-1 n=1 Tax=Glarea lozoyensis (strain ATCC 74030 / MF5533) TaxID=1104152 RepID=H0ED28_GLAL7|nr:putative Sorting nexin mvp-1 [Glarea lozoyensis 74030]
MSLFGSSPEEPAPIRSSTTKPRNTLFDDNDSPAPASKSTLFAEDDAPWGMPTPKKPARGDLVKSLLDGADIPDSYVDIFDSLLKDDALSSGGKISADGITHTVRAGNLDAASQDRIVNLVTSGGQTSNLNRNEFNVLLALIGLAQENEDITLDGVDERRRNLPVPKTPTCRETTSISVVFRKRNSTESETEDTAQAVNGLPRSRPMGKPCPTSRP